MDYETRIWTFIGTVPIYYLYAVHKTKTRTLKMKVLGQCIYIENIPSGNIVNFLFKILYEPDVGYNDCEFANITMITCKTLNVYNGIYMSHPVVVVKLTKQLRVTLHNYG